MKANVSHEPRPAAQLSTDGDRKDVTADRNLVVVSNRLPFTVQRSPEGTHLTRSTGGLVAALDPVLARRGGVWVGWPGLEYEQDEADLTLPARGRVRYRGIRLSAREVSAFYGGFANRTLWPLFHSFVARTRIDTTTWRAYERVNERFAAATVEESDDDSLVWVHDYQLLRVPHHVRLMARRRRIAFFLHIPFPAFDLFRVLPWCRQLLRGMLGADLVGLHVRDYVDHFVHCAERLLGCDVDSASGIVQFEGRQVAVQSHPIGVDADWVEGLARQSDPLPPTLDESSPSQILGIDRLDYTKGIHERFLAFERFLERYPAFRRKVVLTQLVVPSREMVAEYRELKRQLDETVGRINGRFSDRGWTPIRYLARSLTPLEVAALYRTAHVALVTPLRDGMNLVAKEYVAAQIERLGVLVLSELAGAAEELQEALTVNPFDIDTVADTIHRALTMPADERRARMSALQDRVRGNTVQHWVDRFLTEAEKAVEHAALPPSAVDRVQRRLERWLSERHSLALFLDYDGTLTGIVPRPEDATLGAPAREALELASKASRLDTIIVSGRTLDDLRERIGVPGIVYVGNHGFEIEGPGVSFRHPSAALYAASVSRAVTDLQALGIEGAQVEAKGATVTYHMRGVAERHLSEAETLARAVLRRNGLRIGLAWRAVEGRPPVDWHKGHAVLYVLVQRHGADWPSRTRALYLGDDATDEDAFRSLQGIGRSIRVGLDPQPGPSQADYHLPDPHAVTLLLRWLSSGASWGSGP